MSLSYHIQRSFAGGEISPRMLMRTDHEYYKQSVFSMVNYIPTPQGSAVRAPGTRYLQESSSLDARIVPILTTGNERSLLMFTPLGVKLIRNINDRLEENGLALPGDPGTGTVIYRKQIIDNPSFYRDFDSWVPDPVSYIDTNGDGPLGVFVDPNLNNTIRMSPRLYTESAIEADVCTLAAECEVDVATDVITLDYHIAYIENPSTNTGGFEFNVLVSPNADYSAPIYDETYTDVDHPVSGGAFNPGTVNADLPSAGWTGTLYVKLTATAKANADRDVSNPQFGVYYVKAYANGSVELTEADLVTPYTAEDLPDLHYIQSPYDDKEVVITHPRHEPHKFYFNTGGGAYAFIPIVFTPSSPSVWAVNNYPATCGTYQGRLVMAGGQSFKTATGDPVATASETVWCTDSGDWGTFTTSSPVVASDSLEFTATYRSPIQWVHGQKALLIGALEFEYSATAEQGVAAPGDLGVHLHTTHGSNNVQPAAFGSGVLFPADGGTKLRKMTYTDEQQGWIAMDLTLYHPEVCFPYIRRLVRMRNPHQMCLVLTTKGELAIFHSESGIEGWSRYKINGGNIKDVCVVANEEGRDVPFLLIERSIDGTKRLYLEAIPNFSFDSNWSYVDCHLNFNFETPTDTITGLDHLEGKIVHVADQYRYVGAFRVASGQIVITDDIGGTTNMTTCVVGLLHTSTLRTLPPQKLDPGAQAKFLRFAVRVLGSTRPIINGERPLDRDVLSPLNLSQGLDLLADYHVTTDDWNAYQSIEISEHLPFRNEILGIYGKLESNSP